MRHLPASRLSTKGTRLLGRGFTLVEILIVVIILGILAAIVVPQFTSAASESREQSLKANLFRIRQQLQVYKEQHNGNWPPLGADGQGFIDHMTRASNANGALGDPGAAGYPFGPYLTRIPANPETGFDTVGNGAIGSSDWYYNEATGEFRANNTAEDAAF